MGSPTSPCYAWFGETMPRHTQSATAPVAADARGAEDARNRRWAPRDHVAAARPRETAAVGAAVQAVDAVRARCCSCATATVEHLGIARGCCGCLPLRNSCRWLLRCGGRRHLGPRVGNEHQCGRSPNLNPAGRLPQRRRTTQGSGVRGRAQDFPPPRKHARPRIRCSRLLGRICTEVKNACHASASLPALLEFLEICISAIRSRTS